MRPPTLVLLALPSLLAAPARAERHPVFDLVANRPLAHLQRRGGLYVEAGAATMARYVHFSRPTPTFKLRLKEDGRPVALATAAATLELPLNAAQAATQTLYFGLKSGARSTVRVAARGKSSAAVPLQPGWQVVTVKLPDGALTAGENRLSLTFAEYGTFAGQRAAAAVEFVQAGGSAPTKADPIDKGPHLSLPSGGGLAYYVFIPAGGALSATGDAAGCRVTARVDSGPERDLPLDGTPLDLSSHQKRFARLDLSASGSCNRATLDKATLLTEGPAPRLAEKNPPKNVIIWLTDDTRSDKYRFYNPRSRVETPIFDELRKRSTVFKVAYSQGNESRVSHASLWTSLYPSVHQMLSEKAKLKPEFVTLAEAVKPSGRYTAGVMGNGFIDKFWGFGDGWDFLRNNIHDGGGLSAEALLSDAKKVIEQHITKPLFLYIGTIDSHVSWRAHEPWISKYDSGNGPYSGPFVKACLDPQLDKIVLGQMKITERDKTRIIALYDSDVSYNDKVFGELFTELKKVGHDDDTMVILTSDHGEELWDHGRIGHGQSLREELVHVPFLIYYPPYFPAGKVVEEGVDVMDILPTVTDALGVAPPEAAQGESLIPLANGIGAGYPRPAIASQYELAHTMRLGNYKLWVGGSGEVKLFDAATDPHEDHDLMSTRPLERRALTDAMGLWMANRNQWKKRKWGVPSNLLPAFANEIEK